MREEDASSKTAGIGNATPPTPAMRAVLPSSPLHRSERRRDSIDEDSTARDARLVAKRNLEDTGGNFQENSSLSFSSKKITDNIKNIGLSLEKELNTVQSSVSLIKKVEKGRINAPVLKTSEDSHIDLEESDSDFDHIALGHLCGDLAEEVMDDDNSDLALLSNFNKDKNICCRKGKLSRRDLKTKKQIIFQ